MPLEILRKNEELFQRHSARGCALDAVPDHAKRDLSSWLAERRGELSAWEKAKAESALHELERLVGSIKTRLSAKAGEIGSRRIAIVHED